MNPTPHPDAAALAQPLRLHLKADALVANWRWLARQSGSAACGAAVKANGYGLGAPEVVTRLAAAGCRDFFVATWAEAAEIAAAAGGCGVSVLHGVRTADVAAALASPARPVLNSVEQIALWQQVAPDRPCDIMVDTGMNRLGLSASDLTTGVFDGLTVHTVMSHLASADEDSPQNAAQLAAFRRLRDAIPAQRHSLANSAGICLGRDYAFDLTRPGLALYGGIAHETCVGAIQQVVFPQAEVLQIRDIAPGDSVGYNATWRADEPTRVATINLGYADGFLRGFSDRGTAGYAGYALPVIGRVSMDLVTLAVPAGCPISAGDWVDIDFDLVTASQQSGLSQYELLTSLGRRYDRIWQ